MPGLGVVVEATPAQPRAALGLPHDSVRRWLLRSRQRSSGGSGSWARRRLGGETEGIPATPETSYPRCHRGAHRPAPSWDCDEVVVDEGGAAAARPPDLHRHVIIDAGAWAGNTLDCPCLLVRQTGHPRVGGEQVTGAARRYPGVRAAGTIMESHANAPCGASRRQWASGAVRVWRRGTRSRYHQRSDVSRVIPAWAGTPR